MKLTAFLYCNVSVHLAFHDNGLALHFAAHICILPNRQNTVHRGNLAFKISVKDEFIRKLDRAFNFDVLREVILSGYIGHNGCWLCYSYRFSGSRSGRTLPGPSVFRRWRLFWLMG